jgi:GTP cyclohydrolase III
LNKITPVINEAVSSVIKTGATPEDAAEKAIDAIN